MSYYNAMEEFWHVRIKIQTGTIIREITKTARTLARGKNKRIFFDFFFSLTNFLPETLHRSSTSAGMVYGGKFYLVCAFGGRRGDFFEFVGYRFLNK